MKYNPHGKLSRLKVIVFPFIFFICATVCPKQLFTVRAALCKGIFVCKVVWVEKGLGEILNMEDSNFSSIPVTVVFPNLEINTSLYENPLGLFIVVAPNEIV